MKANEFVKKFGSKSAKYWIDHFNNVNTLPDEFINTEFLGDLKRIVESHELVDVEGGIDQVKDTFSFAFKYGADELTEYGKRLKQAIFDVESCQ